MWYTNSKPVWLYVLHISFYTSVQWQLSNVSGKRWLRRTWCPFPDGSGDSRTLCAGSGVNSSRETCPTVLECRQGPCRRILRHLDGNKLIQNYIPTPISRREMIWEMNVAHLASWFQTISSWALNIWIPWSRRWARWTWCACSNPMPGLRKKSWKCLSIATRDHEEGCRVCAVSNIRAMTKTRSLTVKLKLIW